MYLSYYINKELYDLCSPSGVVMIVKCKRLPWVGHAARMDTI